MNTLNTIRQGYSAARQIRAQMKAGVLSEAELERLMKKIEAAFDEVIPYRDPPLETVRLQGRERFGVIQGDRL